MSSDSSFLHLYFKLSLPTLSWHDQYPPSLISRILGYPAYEDSRNFERSNCYCVQFAYRVLSSKALYPSFSVGYSSTIHAYKALHWRCAFPRWLLNYWGRGLLFTEQAYIFCCRPCVLFRSTLPRAWFITDFMRLGLSWRGVRICIVRSPERFSEHLSLNPSISILGKVSFLIRRLWSTSKHRGISKSLASCRSFRFERGRVLLFFAFACLSSLTASQIQCYAYRSGIILPSFIHKTTTWCSTPVSIFIYPKMKANMYNKGSSWDFLDSKKYSLVWSLS